MARSERIRGVHVRPPRPEKSLPALALMALALVPAACENVALAPGTMHEIFVAADSALWSEVEDTVDSALRPTFLTVTEEPTFDVVYQNPTEVDWQRIRTFKQVLVIGSEEDPWVAPAVEAWDEDEGPPPTLFQVRNVWSRNQFVTVILVPEDGRPAETVEANVGELAQAYDRQFRDWARNRMFISGRDTALADTLAREAGFSMLFPDVYDWDRRDSIYLFRNDNPSPDELIRQVMVTWRTPLADSVASVLNRETLLEWRDEVGRRALEFPHVVDTSVIRAGETRFRQRPAFQLRSVWQNPPEADWPAGGPFITRLIACREQDRLYLVDAWLYAPDRDKYEYMLQLHTLLDSFKCGDDL